MQTEDVTLKLAGLVAEMASLMEENPSNFEEFNALRLKMDMCSSKINSCDTILHAMRLIDSLNIITPVTVDPL